MQNPIHKILCVVSGLAAAAPAAGNEFEQVWACKLNPGHSLDEARATSAQWLRAARSMPHGKDFEIVLRWPIAVPDSDGRFEFVVRAPSLAAWGSFYDGYDPTSAAGEADDAFAAVASCSGSTLWEHIAIDPTGSR